MNTVIIAIVMGIMYWWCRGMILSYFGFLFISSPVTVGLVAGLLMGQPMQGLIIGGGIALVFAGIFAPGANLPTDECLAATCVIPIAIGSGMNATTAIALAVPVGLLGSFVTNLRKVINTYFVAICRRRKCRCYLEMRNDLSSVISNSTTILTSVYY